MKSFVLAVLFAIGINAQNTPAPCDPANLQCTDQQYGCYNTPDCDTGFMCFFLRTCTDVWYGTTCSSEGMYFCGRQTIAQKENLAKAIFAKLLPDSLRTLHEKAERLSGLHGFTGSKIKACLLRGKYETTINRTISLRRS